MRYAAEKGVPLHGVELGNEKCGPPPALFAADYKALQKLLSEIWPDAHTRPLLIGTLIKLNTIN